MTLLYLALGMAAVLLVVQTVRLRRERNAHGETLVRVAALEAESGTGPVGEMLKWVQCGSDQWRSVDITNWSSVPSGFKVELRRRLDEGNVSREARAPRLVDALKKAAAKVGEM